MSEIDEIEQLKDKEKEKLKEFREIVQDVLTKPEHDDYYLIRWLRARKFDLKKSEEMLRTHVAWRVEHDVDNILDWQPPEVCVKYFPGGHTGFDKEGRPVWVDYANFDMKGILMSVKRKDIMKYSIWQSETFVKLMKEQSEKTGKRIDRVTMISDMAPLTLKMMFGASMSLMKEMTDLWQDNYPELINVSYGINAPRIFPVLWNMFKHWLNEDTRKRIHILGGDYKEKVLAAIDADQLPVHWGGTMTDPDGDPYCRSKVCLGGTVPESYYLKDQEAFKDEDYDIINIGRSGCHCLTFEILTPGTLLTWVFMTDSHDIKFSVLYKESMETEEETELIGAERVMCHMIPEDGHVECTKPGVYLLKFDNSYSWVHAKKVRYSVQVTRPEDQEIFYDTEDSVPS